MEIFWSGVKVVQVEKVLILVGLKDPGGWNRGRKEMHENFDGNFLFSNAFQVIKLIYTYS